MCKQSSTGVQSERQCERWLHPWVVRLSSQLSPFGLKLYKLNIYTINGFVILIIMKHTFSCSSGPSVYNQMVTVNVIFISSSCRYGAAEPHTVAAFLGGECLCTYSETSKHTPHQTFILHIVTSAIIWI